MSQEDTVMKQLKSSGSDLRKLFDQNITVRHVAEYLLAFEADSPATAARKYMEDADFDLIGVRHRGIVTGYALRADLSVGTLLDHVRPFDPSDLLSDGAPLLTTLQALRDAPRKFVIVLDHVSGIVTRGDMQKSPVRMWLFGLITLIEMQMLRLIRERYPHESWKKALSPGRLEAASRIFELRKQKKEEGIGLIDCLQFCDKREILLKTSDFVEATGIEAEGSEASCMKRLEQVRDRLAHAQDIVTGLWPELVDLAASAEAILHTCEAVKLKSAEPAT